MPNDHRIRIISGLFKGRRLEVLDKEGLRPTTDRVRETVFNWLGNKVKGAYVLDLFAGSGALGLEALSRGASEIVFVEKDFDNAQILKSVIDSLPNLDGAIANVNKAEALEFLAKYKQSNGKPFDVIFLDPPFASDLLESSVQYIVEHELLSDEGVVYIEMDKAKPKLILGLEMICEDTAGQSHYGLYKKSSFF